MAIARLEKPIEMTSDEIDQKYHGRWVLFLRHSINESGFVHGYSDVGNDDNLDDHYNDYQTLDKINFIEFDGRALLVHGCKNRGKMNLHVQFYSE